MKFVLTLLFIGFTALSFGQSKKAVNKQLKYELTWFQNVYDSLQNTFIKNGSELEMIKEDVSKTEHNLRNQIIAIDDLRGEIGYVKKKILALDGDPNQLVSENELNVIFSLITPMNYGDKVRELNDTLIPPFVTTLPDISEEKIKVQNELLQAKIDAYKQTYDQYRILITQQKSILEKLKRLKTSAHDQLDIAVKMNTKLEEKLGLLDNQLNDLEERRYDEQAQKLMDEANKAAKKKKNSKIRFLPPVIKEDEETDDNSGFSIASGDYDNEVSAKIAEPEYPKMQADPIPYYADEMPEFPSGTAALQKYLLENLKYPQSAIDSGIQGKVYIKFIVSATGDITNVTVVRGIPDCLECDAEAYRVISQMPKWKPAKTDGKTIPCYYTIPIIFRLAQ